MFEHLIFRFDLIYTIWGKYRRDRHVNRYTPKPCLQSGIRNSLPKRPDDRLCQVDILLLSYLLAGCTVRLAYPGLDVRLEEVADI